MLSSLRTFRVQLLPAMGDVLLNPGAGDSEEHGSDEELITTFSSSFNCAGFVLYESDEHWQDDSSTDGMVR